MILKWFTLKWNFCSFPWWKEPKIKALGLLLKRISRFFFEIIASRRFILFTPENADFVGDLLRSFLQKSSISVRSQNPTIPRPKVILNWERRFVNEINWSCFLDDLFWNQFSVLLLDQKNEKSRLRDCF